MLLKFDKTNYFKANKSAHVSAETRDAQLHPPRCTGCCRSNGTDGFLTAPVVCEVAVVAATLADGIARQAGMTPLLALGGSPNRCPAYLYFMHGCEKAVHCCAVEIPGTFVNP